MLSRLYVNKTVGEYDRRMEELFADCEKYSVESFDGTRIAYRVVGQGVPIVVCPGVFTSCMFFHYLKDYFAPGYKLIFWDYRGHPESDLPEVRIDLWLRTHFNDLVAEQMTAPPPAPRKAASKKAKRSV